MSYINGPRIVTTGLGLHLDASNIKSFRGEPTRNLCTFRASDNWSTDYAANITQTSDSTVVYSDPASRKIVATNSWNIYQNNAAFYGSTVGGLFTVSWKMKRADNTAPSVGGYIYTTALTTAPAVTINAIGNGWYQCSCNYNNTVGTLTLTGLNTGQTGTFYISDWQVETKSYFTPYVVGTRGTTVATGGGWADLSNTQDATLGSANRYDSLYGGGVTGNATANSSIDVTNSRLYSLGNKNFTYMCWAKVSTGSAAVFYEGRGASLVGTLWTINYAASNVMSLFYTDKPYASQKIYTQPTAYPVSVVNVPHHYAVTVNRTTGLANFFIDGVSYGTANITATTGSVTPDSDFRNLIMYDLGLSGHFTGSIYSFSIYPDQALSATEISSTYNATKGRFRL
jgi:hypothetical protein